MRSELSAHWAGVPPMRSELSAHWAGVHGLKSHCSAVVHGSKSRRFLQWDRSQRLKEPLLSCSSRLKEPEVPPMGSESTAQRAIAQLQSKCAGILRA